MLLLMGLLLQPWHLGHGSGSLPAQVHTPCRLTLLPCLMLLQLLGLLGLPAVHVGGKLARRLNAITHITSLVYALHVPHGTGLRAPAGRPGLRGWAGAYEHIPERADCWCGLRLAACVHKERHIAKAFDSCRQPVNACIVDEWLSKHNGAAEPAVTHPQQQALLAAAVTCLLCGLA